jgi:hypothetical protein
MYMNVKRNSLRTFALLVFIAGMLNACATSASVAPEDQAAQYEKTIRYEREQNYNILRGILKMHSDFRETTGSAEIKLQFDFNDENFSVLRAKYGLDAIAGNMV